MKFISLQFKASSSTQITGTQEVLVFLNDLEYDKTEECLAITVNYQEHL